MADPLVLNIRIKSPRHSGRRTWSVSSGLKAVENQIEVVFDEHGGDGLPVSPSPHAPKLAPITPRVSLRATPRHRPQSAKRLLTGRHGGGGGFFSKPIQSEEMEACDDQEFSVQLFEVGSILKIDFACLQTSLHISPCC
jgi:hypothetical protein